MKRGVPDTQTHNGLSASSFLSCTKTSGPMRGRRGAARAWSSSTRWYSICTEAIVRGGRAISARATHRTRRDGAGRSSQMRPVRESHFLSRSRWRPRAHLVAPQQRVVLAIFEALKDVQKLQQAVLANCSTRFRSRGKPREEEERAGWSKCASSCGTAKNGEHRRKGRVDTAPEPKRPLAHDEKTNHTRRIPKN